MGAAARPPARTASSVFGRAECGPKAENVKPCRAYLATSLPAEPACKRAESCMSRRRAADMRLRSNDEAQKTVRDGRPVIRPGRKDAAVGTGRR